MNNDKPFDVKQCERDGWKCERLRNRAWVEAEYLGELRRGLHVVETDAHRDFCRFENLRNIAKPKIYRWTFRTSVCRHPQVPMQDILVPIIEVDGRYKVDHSDAIIDELRSIARKLNDAGDGYVSLLLESEVARIKKERGDE